MITTRNKNVLPPWFFGMLLGVILSVGVFSFVMFAPLGGFEGRVHATTRFADGTRAPCIHVRFRQLEQKGPEHPDRVNAMLLSSTSSGDGTWDGGGTWPYGIYELIAFADETTTIPVANARFTIWPMGNTYVDLVIDERYKPIPVREFPHGCLQAVKLPVPKQ